MPSLVTRTVREGAPRHGTGSQSTLCVIADYVSANGVVDGDLCNAGFTPLLPRLRVGLLRRWPVAIWHLLVTRTVREGAPLHGTKSQSSLCVIADYVSANAVVNGDLCNAGFTPLLPRLRVGLLHRWPAAIWESVLRCEAPEAFKLLLLAQIDLDLDDMIDQRTKIPAVEAGRFDMGNHLFFNGSARWFRILIKGHGSL